MTRNRSIAVCLSLGCLALHAPADAAAARRKPPPPPVEPAYPDVSYGPAGRNLLDFYPAAVKRPAPVVVNIHGGGFVGGDKKLGINSAMVRALNASGIHFASINYRFVDGKKMIFPAPQLDGARAIQFLRTKAAEWNIDAKRIACVGSSAGAGIALWIGFHDDLADPKNPDPVLRQSSRISAIGSFGGQPTYDPIKIRDLIGGRAWEHRSIFLIWGLRDAEEALNPSPSMRRLYDDASAITWLTKDDPPVFMVYTETDGPLPDDSPPGKGIHHPNFGKMLKKRMDELGIENVLINTDGGKKSGPYAAGDMLGFFKRHLGVDGS